MDNLKSTSFANINLRNPFFDSPRANYDGFDDWFNKKASSGAKVLVYCNGAALLYFLNDMTCHHTLFKIREIL